MILCISGALIPDPDNELRRVHPFFAYASCDWPEGKKLTLTKDTKKTRIPCHSCLVPRELLQIISNAIRNYGLRTAKDMKALFQQVETIRADHGPKKSIEKLETENSFHAHEVSICSDSSQNPVSFPPSWSLFFHRISSGPFLDAISINR